MNLWNDGLGFLNNLDPNYIEGTKELNGLAASSRLIGVIGAVATVAIGIFGLGLMAAGPGGVVAGLVFVSLAVILGLGSKDMFTVADNFEKLAKDNVARTKHSLKSDNETMKGTFKYLTQGTILLSKVISVLIDLETKSSRTKL